jgi:carbonic anhydrase
MGKISQAFNGLVADGADVSDSFDSDDASGQFNLVQDIFNVVGANQYYNYPGSLTTPPCTEGINWFLMANPMYASPLQIVEFTSLLAVQQEGTTRGGDNRLIQPLGSARTVSKSF